MDYKERLKVIIQSLGFAGSRMETEMGAIVTEAHAAGVAQAESISAITWRKKFEEAEAKLAEQKGYVSKLNETVRHWQADSAALRDERDRLVLAVDGHVAKLAVLTAELAATKQNGRIMTDVRQLVGPEESRMVQAVLIAVDRAEKAEARVKELDHDKHQAWEVANQNTIRAEKAEARAKDLHFELQRIAKDYEAMEAALSTGAGEKKDTGGD